MLVKEKQFLDDHEFLEIYQFHPFANLVWPYVTVDLLCLFPGRIINSAPFTPKVINWDEKLYGYHYKISPKPLVLLISKSFPRLFLPTLHDTVCPAHISLPFPIVLSLRHGFFFLFFPPHAYFFPKALLSLLNPHDDESFLTSTCRGFLYFGLGFLL